MAGLRLRAHRSEWSRLPLTPAQVSTTTGVRAEVLEAYAKPVWQGGARWAGMAALPPGTNGGKADAGRHGPKMTDTCAPYSVPACPPSFRDPGRLPDGRAGRLAARPECRCCPVRGEPALPTPRPGHRGFA
jgi:hypothetical protein